MFHCTFIKEKSKKATFYQKSCILIRLLESSHKVNNFAEAWLISKQKSTVCTVQLLPAVGEHPKRDSSISSDTALFLATVHSKGKDSNAASFLGLTSCIGPKENLWYSALNKQLGKTYSVFIRHKKGKRQLPFGFHQWNTEFFNLSCWRTTDWL